MFPELLHIPLQFVDAAGNGPPVFLQLGLPRAAGADPAPLPREREAPAGEPGQAVAQLREFHLETPGGTGGPLGKDVEDELTAVAHGQLEPCLQVPGLGWGEFPIGHHQRRPQTPGFQSGLLHLAFAPKVLADAVRLTLHHQAQGLGPRTAHEAFELRDFAAGRFGVAGAEHQQQHLLDSRCCLGVRGLTGLRRRQPTEGRQIVLLQGPPGAVGVAARAEGRGGPAAAGLGAVAEAQPKTRLQVEPHDGFMAMGL